MGTSGTWSEYFSVRPSARTGRLPEPSRSPYTCHGANRVLSAALGPTGEDQYQVRTGIQWWIYSSDCLQFSSSAQLEHLHRVKGSLPVISPGRVVAVRTRTCNKTNIRDLVPTTAAWEELLQSWSSWALDCWFRLNRFTEEQELTAQWPRGLKYCVFYRKGMWSVFFLSQTQPEHQTPSAQQVTLHLFAGTNRVLSAVLGQPERHQLRRDMAKSPRLLDTSHHLHNPSTTVRLERSSHFGRLRTNTTAFKISIHTRTS